MSKSGRAVERATFTIRYISSVGDLNETQSLKLYITFLLDLMNTYTIPFGITTFLKKIMNFFYLPFLSN